MVEMKLGDVPMSFIRDVSHRLESFSVGFAKLEEVLGGTDATVGGSGTLVEVDGVQAILTASHVLYHLPSKGTLGLILSHNVQRHTVEVGGRNGVKYLQIAHYSESTVREGPDLGAIILTPEIASSIGAMKSFVNLSQRRNRMLEEPPALNEGLWFVQGFLAYLTQDRGAMQGYRRVKEFRAQTSAGWVENAPDAVPYDYFTFPISHGEGSGAPADYGGTSGGGLWQVLGSLSASTGELTATEHLLSGVAFYQDCTDGRPSAVRCHGRKSIYEIAYAAIRKQQ